MWTRPNGELRSSYSADALSAGFAVSSSDGEDCSEGAGEDEMNFAFAECRHAGGPRNTGIGEYGFAGVIFS